jgi:uncharacterized protein YbjT (DUF2867 family)
MHVVLGANGRAGGEVARALVERGAAVRVILRRREQADRWIALGAEVALADIEDAEAMAEALKGASAAFLLNPPPVSGDPYAQTEERGKALAKAVRQAGLPRAVVLSSIGAQHPAGTGVITTLNRFETLLEAVAPAMVFLRSGYFVETWGEVAQAVLLQNTLPTFIESSLKIPMVSTLDVGRVAASLLVEDWGGRRVLELGDNWSAGDVASAFGDVLGRPVAPVFVPPEGRAALLAEEGVPGEVAAALLGMYEGIANGLFTRESSSEHRPGAVSLTPAIERIVAKAGGR